MSDVVPSEPDDALHRPRHRRPEGTRRRSGPWLRAWHRTVYGGAAVAGLVVAMLFASAVYDSTLPRVSGTYTEESCEGGGRYGCKSVGTWTSDDGGLTYRGVTLDGAVGADGTSHAYAVPDAVLGGTETVHDSTTSPLVGVGVVAVLFVMLALGVLRAAEKWGDLARLKESWIRRRGRP